MKQYSIILLIILSLFASITYATKSYLEYKFDKEPLLPGVFRSWGILWNAGTIDFSDVYLDNLELGWDFWIQAAWTWYFQPNTQIIIPSLNPTRSCWTLSGTAFSANIWNIYLTGADTQLFFNPVSRQLEWYWFNQWLHRVWFGNWTACDDGIITDIELAAIKNSTDTINVIHSTNAWFVGRVKIIGRAGGTTIFDTFYSQGAKFNATVFNSTLQRIRKNIAILTRNISSDQKKWLTSVGNRLFFIEQPTQKVSDISSSMMSEIRSIIIVGWDLFIDQNFTGSVIDTNVPKWIIVLADEDGIGWNIYVASGVSRIDAAIFAEWTFYSGTPTDIYNDTITDITSLPPRQLYIYGSLTSRNTIGWASKSPVDIVCPYNIFCDFESSLRYDLNYFRSFQSWSVLNRAYKDSTLDEYSLIIETDTRVLANPPPGFE